MENASKALLIAGGVIISLIIIGVVVYVFSSAKSMQEELDTNSKIQQISQHNKQFEAYYKKVMRGIDIITITNKIIDNNKNHPEYPIEVVITINYDTTTPTTVVSDGLLKRSYYFASLDRLTYTNLLNTPSNVSTFKQERFFEGSSMSYTNTDGRVSKMEFNEITEDVLKNRIVYK